jgi:hypothetical protein
MRVGVTTAAPSPARSVWPATPTVRPGKKQLTRAEYQSTRLRACSIYEAAPKHRSPCPPRKTNLHEDRQVGGGGKHHHQQLFAARGTWRSTGTSKEAAEASKAAAATEQTGEYKPCLQECPATAAAPALRACAQNRLRAQVAPVNPSLWFIWSVAGAPRRQFPRHSPTNNFEVNPPLRTRGARLSPPLPMPPPYPVRQSLTTSAR